MADLHSDMRDEFMNDEKELDELLAKETLDRIAKTTRATIAEQDKLLKYTKKRVQDSDEYKAAMLAKGTEREEEAQKKLQRFIERASAEAVDAMVADRERKLSRMNAKERADYYKAEQDRIKAAREARQKELDDELDKLESSLEFSTKTEDEKSAIRKAKIKEAAKLDNDLFIEQLNAAEAERAALELVAEKDEEVQQRKLALQKELSKSIDIDYKQRSRIGGYLAKEAEKAAEEDKKHIEELKKAREKNFDDQLKKEQNLEELNRRVAALKLDEIEDEKEKQKILEDNKALIEAKKKAQEDYNESVEEGNKLAAEQEATEKSKAQNAAKAEVINGLANDFQEKLDAAESALIDYSGKVSARLQGSGKSWATTSSILSMSLLANPFVKVTDAIDNLNAAVYQGIAYNVESRAFLATVSENIANTFDAFSEDMARIIRLQQADTTAARLGMEANLTNFLNRMFEDSSYLTNAFDNVAGALLEASSQMSYKGAAEFEYVVQKWLGALSSLGLSSETVNTIATGLSYLATGDVQSLAGNSSLQTLMAMSASRAGIDYAEVLLEGLDAETTNKLLTSMVSYLKEIAEESENQVVKRAYGDVFNLSMSDLRAIQNITQSEISSISGANMSYSAMQAETNKQLLLQATRVALPAMLDNIYSNTMYGVAQMNNNNPAMWAMGKMLSFLDENKTTINIPFINAMGFGLDLNSDVVKLMHMGYGIGTGMSLLGTLLAGLSTGGAGLGLGAFGGRETTRRGAAFGLNMGSTKGETSASQYVSSGSSSDMSTSTMSSATDDAEESKKITNKNSKPPEKTLDDLFEAIIGEKAKEFVRAEDVNLKNAYISDKSGGSIRVALGGLGDNGLLVHDALLLNEVQNISGLMSHLSISQIEGNKDTAAKIFKFTAKTQTSLADMQLTPEAFASIIKKGFGGFIPTYDIGMNASKVLGDATQSTMVNIVNTTTDKLGKEIHEITSSTWESLIPSHKTGLFRVPYNGYLAELHEGERILTAEEAKFYNQYSNAVNEIPSTPISNVGLQPTADIEIDLTPLQGNLTSETEKIVTAINLLKAEVEKINNKPIQTQSSSIEAKTDKTTTDLASTLRQVLYGDNSEQTIGKLITHMLNGQININRINTAVPVKNDAGNKLQVSNLVW